MSWVFWIAQTIAFKGVQKMTRRVVFLAIISIALGLAVMEVSVSIVSGFQNEIRDKLIGFAAHIQVGAYMPEANTEIKPLALSNQNKENILKNKHVKRISPYITKPALLKSKSGMEGIILKGLDNHWNKKFFSESLISGQIPTFDTTLVNEIFISKKLANILGIKAGDKTKIYFLEEKVRARVVFVKGIYETGMAEFDQMMVLCNIQLLRNIMNWGINEVEGYDIELDMTDNLPQFAKNIDKSIPADTKARAIQDIFPELFDWIKLQFQNVYFILALMIAIAVINMASAVIILIIERTRMIGILKAMGANNRKIQFIFLINSFIISILGVLIGNLIGLGIIALQYFTGLFTLDQEAYFVKKLPVEWTWNEFFWINLGTIVIITCCMWIPTWIVTKIKPVKALKFH